MKKQNDKTSVTNRKKKVDHMEESERKQFKFNTVLRSCMTVNTCSHTGSQSFEKNQISEQKRQICASLTYRKNQREESRISVSRREETKNQPQFDVVIINY